MGGEGKKRQYYPLCPSQAGVLAPFFLPEHEDVFLRFSFIVSGEYDLAAMKKAFCHLVETQEALRLRLRFSLRGLRQYAAPYEPFDIPVVALGKESELDGAIHAQPKMSNPLFGGPMYRAMIFTYDGGASLYMGFCHLCFDGYSVALTTHCLKEFYRAYADGKTPQDGRCGSYLSCCGEDAAYRRSERFREDRAYWKETLGAAPYLSRFLPRQSLRKIYSPTKTRQHFLDGALYDSMAAFCRGNGVSTVYFLSAAAALTARCLTGKKKIAFTGLSHGRSTALQKRMVGMTVSSFFSLYDLSDGQRLSDYFSAGYLSYLDNIRHSRVSIYRVVLDSARTWLAHGYIPTCSDVYFGSLGQGDPPAEPGYSHRYVVPRYSFSQFYLIVSDNRRDRVGISNTYQTGHYSEEQIDRITAAFFAVVAYVLAHPERTIAQLAASEELAQWARPDATKKER